MRNRLLTGAAFVCVLLCPARPASADEGAVSVRGFLDRHCLACHSGEEAEGHVRLDELPDEFGDRSNAQQWLTTLEKVTSGEMPPQGEPRPPQEEVQALSATIRDRIQTAAAARRAKQGRVVFRRLNRIEYENTIRDLLGVQADLKELLPLDTSAHGFDNIGEALHVSSFLLERYLEAADVALNLAIADAPQPKLISQRYRLHDERQVQTATESVYRPLDDAVVLFSSSPWSAVHLYKFYPPDRGKYRVRISASGFQSSGKPVAFRVDAGPFLMGQKNHLVGYFDAPPDKPAIIEFVDHLEARNTLKLSPYGTATAFTIKDAGGAEKYPGAGLAIEWIEVEGPLHDTWPPESHRRIFGDLPQERVGNRLEVVSSSPSEDARRILRQFAARAFRRNVTDVEVMPFVELVEAKLAESYSFEQAMRVGLKAVLVSPQFLFLQEKPGQLDDFALATRLSYFLWSSMPDQRLLDLAGEQKLSQPATLREEVERMLSDPKAATFTESFVDQWLGLRDIDFTTPDRQLYPEFDDLLKVSMVEEAHRFFQEVLRHDLSITQFVASDFTMLNARLAKHYGIPGVEGWEFRKVPLPPESHRGGVITMAAVLKVTANGTTTSPVVRGAWVLDRILGTPPAPPPAGVPAVEPDIRGAATIREQLAKHRQIESCASCHKKIDPPGFALESFDVIGGWRENYRSVGRGEAVMIDGARMPYYKGPAVDCADVLPDGRTFQNIDELKALYLQDKDRLARALAGKLVTYATGHAPEPADQPELDAIVARLRDKNYGLRAMVHEIVQSSIFQHK